MPAAAVIPAPIAYINVVAVKKLVVGFLLMKIDVFMAIWFSDASFWKAYTFTGVRQPKILL